MKQKYKNLLVIGSLAAVITIIIFGVNSWDQKIEHSGAAATEVLKNEGIKIRTVDTSRFEEQTKADAKPAPTNTDDSANEPSSRTTETNSGSENIANETPPPTTEASVISSAEIKEKYVLQFLPLEGEISSRLDVILNEAVQDYNTKKSNGEEINLLEFQRNYAIKITNLEKESDKRFAEIYLQFEAELVENDYQKSEANPYQAKYLAEKQNREGNAVARLKDLL